MQKWLIDEKKIAVNVQAELNNGEFWYSADICSAKFGNLLVDEGYDITLKDTYTVTKEVKF